MKNTLAKKSVFFVGLLGTLLVLALVSLETSSCYANTFCMKTRSFFSKDIFILIFLTPPLFFLSLITYKMQDEVFRAWWNFARWWVPVIILATLGVNLGINALGSGADMFDRGFSNMFIGLLYAIFVAVSLWRIFRKYRELKHEGE